jgi:hypothetical protein
MYICLFLEIGSVKWVWIKVICEKVKGEMKEKIGLIFIIFFPLLFQGVVFIYFSIIQIVVKFEIELPPFHKVCWELFKKFSM